MSGLLNGYVAIDLQWDYITLHNIDIWNFGCLLFFWFLMFLVNDVAVFCVYWKDKGVLFSEFCIITAYILLIWVFCTVHAVNLQSICPFSLSSVVPYGVHDHPHCPAYAPPAKQAVPAKHTAVGRESAFQSSVTTSSQTGYSHSSCDRANRIPQLAPQQKLTEQPLARAMESAGLSHIPGQLQQLFTPVQQHFICWQRSLAAVLKIGD